MKTLCRFSLVLITLLASIIILILHYMVFDKTTFLVYIQLFLIPFFSLIVVLISMLFKIKIPLALNIAINLHLILTIGLGTVMDLYQKIFWWDLFVHGMFGSIAVYSLMTIFKNDNYKYCLAFSLASLGLGGLWELFEYSGDVILGNDVQRINESINNNKLPQADIMEDLLVTLIGALLFVGFYLLFGFIQERNSKTIKKKVN